MNLIKSHKFILIWLIFGIPIISYLLFQKTFNLALFGDDWLQLYNLWVSFDVNKTLSFFDIKSYLGAYWPQYFFLGVTRYFFGYEAPAYFAFSLILRILATVSLFFLVEKISKSKLAGILSTLIFTFSVAGIQTTDWVFNMNTYAGILFLNLALVFYLKIRELKSLFSWHYLAFILFFILALGVVPVRMHGAVPFLIITELLFLFTEKDSSKKINKLFFIRLILPITIIFVLIKGGSFGSEGDTVAMLKTNFIYLQDMIQKGKFDILFYFFGIIGNIISPDTLNIGPLFVHLISRTLFFIFLTIIILFPLRVNRNTYILAIILSILVGFTGKTLTSWNPLLSSSSILSICLGFYIPFLTLLIFINKKKTEPKFALLIIVGLVWVISFSLLYWLRTPYLIIESTGRYMTMGAVGFSILFASLLSMMFKNFKSIKKFRGIYLFIPLTMLISWLCVNFIAMETYLTDLETNRNLSLASKVWGTLKREVPNLDKNEGPSIFYFTYDNDKAANMVLIFGFSPHAGLSYNISTWENTPIPGENYLQLLEIAKTGAPLKNIHARKEKPVPLSRIFSFDLRNGVLTSTTDLIRQKLAQDLKTNQLQIVTTPTQ